MLPLSATVIALEHLPVVSPPSIPTSVHAHHTTTVRLPYLLPLSCYMAVRLSCSFCNSDLLRTCQFQHNLGLIWCTVSSRIHSVSLYCALIKWTSFIESFSDTYCHQQLIFTQLHILNRLIYPQNTRPLPSLKAIQLLNNPATSHLVLSCNCDSQMRDDLDDDRVKNMF